MTVWFTSDPHLGHEKVAKIRGFETSLEHDAALFEHWSKTVKPEDQLWILGDLSLGEWRQALNLCKRLPGHKHFIAGNHDPVHSMHRNAHKFQKEYLEVFESVQAFARRRVLSHSVMLSHFPYDTDHTEEIRYTQYRLRNEGRWLLHGHTHSNQQINQATAEIHVGLDAWDHRFVPLEEIEKIILARQVESPSDATKT